MLDAGGFTFAGASGSITKNSGGSGHWLMRSLYFIFKFRLNFPR